MKVLADLPTSTAECEALYRENGPRVLRLARLLLDDRQEAQDVAQEVFLKLLRAYPAEDRPMRWGPWLTKVTVNACRDRRRSGWWRWWRAAREPIEDLVVVDLAPTPERAALDAAGRERIGRVFRQLPARQREAVALRYVEGWTTREVAEQLGVTTGSVKRHLFRAIKRLRSALGDGT
jgi:RNA polymerase sigma-70 factor (ECF subfamily)